MRDNLSCLAICCECSGAVFGQEACSRCGGRFSIAPSSVAFVESVRGDEEKWFAEYPWLRGIVRYDEKGKRFTATIHRDRVKYEGLLTLLRIHPPIFGGTIFADAHPHELYSYPDTSRNETITAARVLAERIDEVSCVL